MQDIMRNDYGLKKAKLVVKQTEGVLDITQQTQLLEDFIVKKDSVINEQKTEISVLQAQMEKLTGSSENTKQIVREIKSQYSDIKEVAISEIQCYDASTLTSSSLPVVYLSWSDRTSHPDAERRLLQWLKVRLNVEEIRLMRVE